MSKTTLFYAVRDDVLLALKDFEARQYVKYVTMGGYSLPDYELFLNGSDIPDLGKATQPAAGGCDSYLVFRHETPVRMREIGKNPQARGFVMDQLVNPDTIEFTPAGIWNDEIVLHGRVATASDTPCSQGLLKAFRSSIKKHFVKVKAFYVGTNALELLKQGRRL